MIETVLALLASATFIWSVSIIAIIAIAILLENEFEGWATTILSLGIALWLWNYGSDIWGFVSSSPLETLGFAAMYLLFGVSWSFFKWFSYVKDIYKRFTDIKDRFNINYGSLVETNPNWVDFVKMLNGNYKNSDGYGYQNFYKEDTLKSISARITPLASDKKTIITAWISYWPISLAGTLLNNPFRKFFSFVYESLSGYYDKITNKYRNEAFGNLNKNEN